MNKILFEIAPDINYLYHMLSVARCGYDNEYGAKYRALYPPEEQRYLFEEWANTYFARLGLGMDSEYVRSLDVSWTEQNAETDSLRVNCDMLEIQYGLVTVSFTVKPGGFYISFSGSQEGMKWGK